MSVRVLSSGSCLCHVEMSNRVQKVWELNSVQQCCVNAGIAVC